MSRKLIALIDTKGKAPKEVHKEIVEAINKHKDVYTCPECAEIVKKVPLSNYEEDGKIIHVPSSGRANCDNCGWQSKPYGYGLLKKPSTK